MLRNTPPPPPPFPASLEREGRALLASFISCQSMRANRNPSAICQPLSILSLRPPPPQPGFMSRCVASLDGDWKDWGGGGGGGGGSKERQTDG